MPTLRMMILLGVLAFSLTGCAGTQKELLDKDYLHMSNEELITYYDNLSAEIARCSGGRDMTSVGVGTGYSHGGVGLSFGLSQFINTCNPDKLMVRKNEVGAELHRRGRPIP